MSKNLNNVEYLSVILGCLIVGFSLGTLIGDNNSQKGIEMSETSVYCPSCGSLAYREGKNIVCEKCDATFEFKKTGAAQVRDIGRLQSLEERMDHVESLLPGQEPDPAANEPNPADNEPNPADDDPNPAAEETSLLG